MELRAAINKSEILYKERHFNIYDLDHDSDEDCFDVPDSEDDNHFEESDEDIETIAGANLNTDYQQNSVVDQLLHGRLSQELGTNEER